MNKLNYLLAIVFIIFSTASFAQGKPPVPDQQTRVVDSAGMVYPYIAWRKLLSSGNYTLRSHPANDGSLLISWLSAEQKKRRNENMPKPRESKNFETGTKLSNFVAYDMDGKKYKSKDMAGKIIVMNFWFINCPPCRQEIPELNALVAKYKNNPDVVFLGVALDSRSALKDFLKSTPFNYAIIDDGRSIAAQYGIQSYPTHVITDRNKNVLFHTNGLAPNTVDWIGKSIEMAMAVPLETQEK